MVNQFSLIIPTNSLQLAQEINPCYTEYGHWLIKLGELG